MLVTYHHIRSSARVCYFLIKSFQTDHIQLSQKHSVWATTSRNERSIVNAYENYEYVVLIFSVNASGKFYGYAVVSGLSPQDNANTSPVFVASDGRPFPGRPFGVQWVCNLELPFKHFDQITNSYNDNKPVKVGRDGQLIAVEAGNQILDVYQNVVEQHASAAPTAQVAGGWMLSPADNQIEWEGTVLNTNPLLSIYPIDLTKFTYQSYCDLYNASAEYLQTKEAVFPPIKGYVDWSGPEHVSVLSRVLKDDKAGG